MSGCKKKSKKCIKKHLERELKNNSNDRFPNTPNPTNTNNLTSTNNPINTNTNTFNPIINFTPSTSAAEPQSAFRAINSVEQLIPVTGSVKVLFQTKQFDLNNEYNAATSTFIAKQPGIYSIIATVNFVLNQLTPNYRVLIEIHVNGTPIAADNDFFGPILIGNVASVSTIFQLKTDDLVEVFASSSAEGTIVTTIATNFQAARFPS